MLTELHSLYRDTPPKTQLELLRIMPHRTRPCAMIRKWLAWAFIVGKWEDHTAVSCGKVTGLLKEGF